MSDDHKKKMQALQEVQRLKVKSATDDRGIIVVNTGDGKGKSTAAFAAGRQQQNRAAFAAFRRSALQQEG